ncbi:MAG: Hpt domain-containing protein [Janthinobacterium lividum]
MAPLPDPHRTLPHSGAAKDPEPGDFPLFIRELVIDTMDQDIARLRNLSDLSPSPRITRDIAAMLHRLQGTAAILRWRSMATMVERARQQMASGKRDGIAPLVAFWKRRRRVWMHGIAAPATGANGGRELPFRATPDS